MTAATDKPDSRYLVITELFQPTKGGTAVWFDEVYRRMGGAGDTEGERDGGKTEGAIEGHGISPIVGRFPHDSRRRLRVAPQSIRTSPWLPAASPGPRKQIRFFPWVAYIGTLGFQEERSWARSTSGYRKRMRRS